MQINEIVISKMRDNVFDDGDKWDAQIEADAAAGKLDTLVLEALTDYHAGKSTEIG